MISPGMNREYALPYEKWVIQKVHEGAGAPISLHICGNADAILEDMAQTGADMLEIDQKSKFLKLAREVQKKYPVCILGNISPERLRNGGPEEVRGLGKRGFSGIPGRTPLYFRARLRHGLGYPR